MTNNTKLILLGLAVCVVLGIVLQQTIFSSLQKDLGGTGELLTPDEMAKKAKTEAYKTQKKFEQKNKEAAK